MVEVVGSILAIGALIAVHEWGHYLVARASRMRVDSFSIGFGPALLSVRGRHTTFRIGIVPLGGYVRIAGLNPHDGTAPEDPASYANRPIWQRLAVIVAGPLMNYLVAYLILVAAMVAAGLPELVDEPSVHSVKPGTPAAHAGLRPGDRVVSINAAPVARWTDVVRAIQSSGGAPLRLVIDREGATTAIDVRPDVEDGVPFLGIWPPRRQVKSTFDEALGRAFRETVRQSAGAILAIRALIKREKGVRVQGPIGIVEDLGESAAAGGTYWSLKIAQISLALFMLNLLPLAALDGGRLAFLLIALVRRKPVNQRIETAVHAVGFLLLLGLLVVVTFSDIGRLLDRSRRQSERNQAGAAVVADGGATSDGG